jgi:hypothetical protein
VPPQNRLARSPGNARRRLHLARKPSLRQIPLQGEPDVGRLVARLEFDTAKVLANLIELSDQSLQGRATLKTQDLSRLSIQCRTVGLNIVDIDPDINYIRAHRRLLIAYVARQPLEVSIDDGSPRVKKGASISSILWSAIRAAQGSTVLPLCGSYCADTLINVASASKCRRSHFTDLLAENPGKHVAK